MSACIGYFQLIHVNVRYGCPSMEELEKYCQEYRKRLDEVGAVGEIPDNLAVEVIDGQLPCFTLLNDTNVFRY